MNLDIKKVGQLLAKSITGADLGILRGGVLGRNSSKGGGGLGSWGALH